MAVKSDKKPAQTPGTNLRGFWADQIAQACKRFESFHKDGDDTVTRYRLSRDGQESYWRDKYNILYSSTETMKPSLYASTPKVEATIRHKDRQNNENVVLATMLIEGATQYALEEVDFDDVLENVVEDYLLPGLGQAWVRYDPEFTTVGEEESSYDAVSGENVAVDYVHWKDFLTDDIRVWREKRWCARRVYLSRHKAEKRFGEAKAAKLQYTHTPDKEKTSPDTESGTRQAIVYEIWDKEKREAIWFSPDYADDVLDRKPDPLKLKNFFPCPRPLRAIRTTNTFTPRAFYSQYRPQAEVLDDITQRIRILTKALRVVGVYDSSQAELSKLLTGNDNRMVPVENWAMFASNNGINGSVQYLPIKDIATVLGELYKQREIAKNEIYEITGFSDIVRGVSKASETLGAQEIKNQWATGRLRSLQKEVQRFCRDLIRIMSEIISEHFEDASLALYAGFEPPEVTPEEQAAVTQYATAKLQYQTMGGMTLGQEAPQPPPPTQRQQVLQQFKAVAELLRKEKTRCALIGIETDSTIQPDEAQERKDRMEFLGQIGAFLQQAGPMALQYPDMRGLLGSIMMFTIRTFRSSRPLEKDFEEFTKKLAGQPAMPPPGQGGEGNGTDPAAAQAQVQGEQIKAQAAQQQNADKLAMEKYKVDAELAFKREELAANIRMKELELQIKQAELQIKQQGQVLDVQQTERQEQRADQQAMHQQDMDYDGADRADRELDANREAAEAKTVEKRD